MAMVLSIAVQRKDWIFALTNITYITVTMYFLYAAIAVSYQHWAKSRVNQYQIDGKAINSEPSVSSSTNLDAYLSNEDIHVCCKIHWFLYTVALNSCTFVFIAFWLVLIAPSGGLHAHSPLIMYIIIDHHGLNFLLLIVDFFMNRIPVRILHCVYSSLFIGSYYVYNSIYWSITKRLIYGKILDYGGNTGLAVGLAFASVIVASPAIQFFWCFAFLLKKKFILQTQGT